MEFRDSVFSLWRNTILLRDHPNRLPLYRPIGTSRCEPVLLKCQVLRSAQSGAAGYDAALGRFIQADTIIPGAGDSKSYDRYAYVNNNPVRYTDPSGHCIAFDGSVRATEYPSGTSGLCRGEVSDITGIFTSGYGTGENNVSGDDINQTDVGQTNTEYGNQIPLGSYRNVLVNNGVPSYLFGISGRYDINGNPMKTVKAKEIESLMRKIVAYNPNAKFFLMGHSAGSDTTALAISFFIADGYNTSRIVGGVLADPSIWDNGNSEDGKYADYPHGVSDADELGVQTLSENLGDLNILILKSLNYSHFGLPEGMSYDGAGFDYSGKGLGDSHHLSLAVDSNFDPYQEYLGFVHDLGIVP